MSNWQSAIFARVNRFAGTGRVGAGTEIDELRARFDRLSDGFGPVPGDAQFKTAQLGPVRGEWVRVAASAGQRLILYFHGGGYVAGSPERYRPLVARLCQAAEASAYSVAYRKGPEVPFPAGLRDGLDAYRYLLAHGVPASSIVLAGDGAGGGLAFSSALAIRNSGLAMPAAIVAMSPWADLALSGWSVMQNARSDVAMSWDLLFVCARHYLRKQSAADPYASPVYASFKDFPPIMVHAGSTEILRDDASRIGDRAAEAGIPVSVEIYDGMPHVFQANPKRPEAAASLDRLGRFIRAKALDGEEATTEALAAGE